MVIKLRNPRPAKTSPKKGGELYPEPKKGWNSWRKTRAEAKVFEANFDLPTAKTKGLGSFWGKRRTRFCSLACTWACQSLHLKVGNQQLIQRKNRVLLIQREPPGPFLIPTNAWVNKRTLLKDKLYPREDSMGRLQTKSTPKDENLVLDVGRSTWRKPEEAYPPADQNEVALKREIVPVRKSSVKEV